MKKQIAESMYNLLGQYSYKEVTIRMLCESVPVSRPTFYHYFTGKDDLIKWMIQQDYRENAIPVFKHHLKEHGTQSFFTYIKRNRIFYMRLYAHDDGVLLFHLLVDAYNTGVDMSASYSRPPSYNLPKIDQEVYRRYCTTGIAAVVTYWIENDMSIPVEKIALDLYLMISNPLEVVRDNCL